MEVHQFLASFVDHDAISSHVRHLRDLLREMGVRSDVYAWEWRGARSTAMDFHAFAPRSSDAWILYHLSTASDIARFVQERPERLAVNYHNITPAELFAPWEPSIGRIQERARDELKALAPRTSLGIGASDYNATELRDVGYGTTTVAPVLFDPEDYREELDVRLVDRLRSMKSGGGADWLFVGRVAPHKCQHDILKAFAVYQRLYDPAARLHIVGGSASHLYSAALHRYVEALGLASNVNLAGSVSNGELGAYYAAADVFVCLSEHEGFGVPLIEALHNQLPVIAYDAAAVGEVLGGGGLLLRDKAPATVAAAVHQVLSRDSLRAQMVRCGTERLQAFSLATGKERWRSVLTDMLEGGASRDGEGER